MEAVKRVKTTEVLSFRNNLPQLKKKKKGIIETKTGGPRKNRRIGRLKGKSGGI